MQILLTQPPLQRHPVVFPALASLKIWRMLKRSRSEEQDMDPLAKNLDWETKKEVDSLRLIEADEVANV